MMIAVDQHEEQLDGALGLGEDFRTTAVFRTICFRSSLPDTTEFGSALYKRGG